MENSDKYNKKWLYTKWGLSSKGEVSRNFQWKKYSQLLRSE